MLQASGITRRFGGVLAVDNVDLAVHGGEAVGIIGPNGSGKSTFLSIISGALKANSGSVTWQGVNVTKHPAEKRSLRGLVRTFQHTSVFPNLTVWENLQVPGIVRGHAPLTREQAEELLRRVSAPLALLELPAGNLSWGQSRLLGVCIALACEPALILLDEPLAGLSPPAADQMVSVLRNLRADGMTIVVIDHDIGQLTSLCDRLVLFDLGRKVAEGPPSELVGSQVIRDVYFGMA